MASAALMAFAITVTVLAGDADAIRITHNRILTLDDCAKWQLQFKKEKRSTVDPSGRMIRSRTYECVPVYLDDLGQMLATAGAPFP
ncbi:MAG: hypothetical protein DI537_14045 [Stutzerimonas stutzeri]|nr:MAG: hypothetical protein DI537_14045 [Stutzerimonas stutzeri]